MNPDTSPKEIKTFNDKGEMVSTTPAPEREAVDPSSSLKQIRTFQGDVADALHKQNESLVSIQRSEQAVKEARKVFTPPKTPEELAQNQSNKKLLLLLVGSLILVGLGGSVSWYAYQGYITKTALPTIEQIPNRLITSTKMINVDTSTLSRETFINKIKDERAQDISDGAIIQIQLQKQIATTTTFISTRDFLNLLESRASGSLLRSFNPIFMLGLLGAKPVNVGDGGLVHTFILVKLDSFDNAFPGMLDWEKNLRDDLLPIFASEATFATTSPTTLFSDITIQNKDARILKDSSGRTVLLYSFFDNKMLIITDTEISLKTIVGRLNAEKLSR